MPNKDLGSSFNDKSARPFTLVDSPIFADRYGGIHDFRTKKLPIKIRLGGFAVIVADKHILLNFPPWAEKCRQKAGVDQWCAELPGGGVKREETLETGLLRELEEETGLIFPEGKEPPITKADEFYINLFAEDVNIYYRYLQKFYFYDISDHLNLDQVSGLKSSLTTSDLTQLQKRTGLDPAKLKGFKTPEGTISFWLPLDQLGKLKYMRLGHEHIIREAALHECKPDKIKALKSKNTPSDGAPPPRP